MMIGKLWWGAIALDLWMEKMGGFADINRYGLLLMVLGPMFISRMIRK